MAKFLDLVMEHKWYNMIAEGEKTEEYREIKPFYIDRVIKFMKDSEEPHFLRLRKGYSSIYMEKQCVAYWIYGPSDLYCAEYFAGSISPRVPKMKRKWGFDPDKELYIFMLI